MRTEASFVRCDRCSVLYDPASSGSACPHNALTETALLRSIREAGPPYKLLSGTVPF